MDLVDPTEAMNFDDLIHHLKDVTPEEFDTEETAKEFYQQHLTTHDPPVYLCSLQSYTGSPFTGRCFSEYRTAPAGSWIEVAIDCALDNPIRCTLADDWQFRLVEVLVNQKISHKTVRRHTDNPVRELLEALYEVEAALYDRYAVLSTDALRDFWSSVEIHRHLRLHALKMERYRGYYSASITEALDHVRRHMADYVTEVLGVSKVSAQAKGTPSDLARKIRGLKADGGATVEELVDLFNLDRKTLRKIERGERVRQSTIDKSPAWREAPDRLSDRLLENRRRKHNLN
jgi:hypothetical protein